MSSDFMNELDAEFESLESESQASSIVTVGNDEADGLNDLNSGSETDLDGNEKSVAEDNSDATTDGETDKTGKETNGNADHKKKSKRDPIARIKEMTKIKYQLINELNEAKSRLAKYESQKGSENIKYPNPKDPGYHKDGKFLAQKYYEDLGNYKATVRFQANAQEQVNNAQRKQMVYDFKNKLDRGIEKYSTEWPDIMDTMHNVPTQVNGKSNGLLESLASVNNPEDVYWFLHRHPQWLDKVVDNGGNPQVVNNMILSISQRMRQLNKNKGNFKTKAAPPEEVVGGRPTSRETSELSIDEFAKKWKKRNG